MNITERKNSDGCIKDIIVHIDPRICKDLFGLALKNTLLSYGVSINMISQILPNLISWSRLIQEQNVGTEITENQSLLILTAADFKEYVKTQSLAVHIENVLALTEVKYLTVAVIGIEKVKPYQETMLIEAQVKIKSYFRFIKEEEELGNLVMELTKIMAQIPYKKKIQKVYNKLNEYFDDSNKRAVRIDGNGNGLYGLWHQMLSMFPMVRLETAEAITTVYPTPSVLFEAYKTCDSKKEDLLQNLFIRRARNPCLLARRIGPELSRKCSNFFYSTDNTFL